MRLRDHVDVLHSDDNYDTSTVVAANVPAEVHYVTVATNLGPGRQSLIEELRAVVAPMTFDPATNRLRWRGQVYSTDGPAMVRRRNGADHHLTIPMRYAAG